MLLINVLALDFFSGLYKKTYFCKRPFHFSGLRVLLTGQGLIFFSGLYKIKYIFVNALPSFRTKGPANWTGTHLLFWILQKKIYCQRILDDEGSFLLTGQRLIFFL